MASTAEVHVGDIGTTYRVKITDAGDPFDPTLATTKSLIFRMPQGLVTLPATVVNVAPDWFLEAVITGTGPSTNFHSTAGRVQLQAFVEFADGTQYHSSIQSRDENGEVLQVHENLI